MFNQASWRPGPAPPPPLLGLSSELHVAGLPTASSDKPSCRLTTSFLMLAGRSRAAAAAASQCVRACVCARTRSHAGFKGNAIPEVEEFPNDQTQAAPRVFASPRLCCLSVGDSHVRHCFCLSFTLCLLFVSSLY